MEEYITLKKKNVLKFGIRDENNDPIKDEKGDYIYLEFDTEDIELPLRLNQCEAEHRKNLEYLKMQSIIIDKKNDKTGKYLLTSNQEQKIKLIKEFYTREMKALDLFLGQGGCKKLLNGRKPYWNMFDDFVGEDGILNPILPKLKCSFDGIANQVKNKYSSNNQEKVLK